MASQDRTSPSSSRHVVDAVAFLVGTGTGLAAIGFAEQFYRVLDPTPLTWRLVWGACLASLAIGPSLPQGLVRWVTVRAVRRWRRDLDFGEGESAQGPTDLALFWTVLAGLSLVAGLALAGLPLITRVAEIAYRLLLREFLWPPSLLTVVETGVVFLSALIPFALVGWVIRCVHGVADPVGRWGVRPLAWLLLGGAVAAAGAMVDKRNWLPPAVLAVLASGPFFVVAIVAVRRSDRHDARVAVSDQKPPRPPTESDRWPVVVRLAVACVTAAGACGMVLWSRALSVLGGAGCRGETAGCVLLLSASAIGVFGCSRVVAKRHVSTGGFGVAVVVAGMTVAAGIAAAATWFAGRAPGESGGWQFWTRAAVCAGVPWITLGAAVAYGHRAVLARAGSRAAAGATLLSLSLAGAGASILLILLPAIYAVGTYASMAAVALTLVAVGGVLIIHEPAPPGRTRRNRLIAVFAIVVLMSVALPAPAEGWLLTRPGTRLRLLEAHWLTRSVWFRSGRPAVLPEPPPKSYVDRCELGPTEPSATLLSGEKIPPETRVVLIGDASPELAGRIGVDLARDNWFPFDPSAVDAERAVGGYDGPQARTSSSLAGTRALRTRPGELDVVFLSLDGLSVSVRNRLLTAGTLDRAHDSLTPDGMVAVLLPLASVTADEIRRWIDRTAAITDSRFLWSCLSGTESPTLVLIFGREGAWRQRWARWSRHPGRDPAQLPGTWAPG